VGRGDRFGAAAATLAAGGGGRPVGDEAGEALLGHLGDVGFDRAQVGGRQPGLAAEDDHRGREFAVLQRLGRVQGGCRFGVAGQVGGRLVAFGVFELAGQVGRSGGDEDAEEPDGEDDPLGAAAGGERQEGAAHLCILSRAGSRAGPVVGEGASGRCWVFRHVG